MNMYNVCIIGCGSIGALKPDHIDAPGSGNILTHCNAINRHNQTELLAIVDTDDQQLRKANIKWQPQLTVRSFEDILSNGKQLDIVIVAVPTEYHFEVLSDVLKYQPKLIIAEKPFCSDFNSADLIMNLSKEYCTDGCRRIPIMVDYIRRFSGKYQEIKWQIDSGVFGKALNCRVLYTKGLRHEGCHAIDLMNWFFGKCIDSWDYAGNSMRGEIVDKDESDPTKCINFDFQYCPHVIFQPCDGRQYGIFEIDICFEKGRLRFIDNGLFVESYPINQENEWGHKSLDYNLTSVIRTETNLNIALYNLIDNAVKFLDGEEELICTAGDAIEVHKILEDLR